MLPKDHLWPIDDFWNFHAGGGEFKYIHVYSDALTARYGKADTLDDYVKHNTDPAAQTQMVDNRGRVCGVMIHIVAVGHLA